MNLFTHTPATSSASAIGGPSNSISGEPRTGPITKTRLACNRCHAQKLKCVRKAGQASSCDRCSRLKTPCRYDPRTARSSLKLPDQVAVEATIGGPLIRPTSYFMPTPYSGITDGFTELEWLCPPDRSIYADIGQITQTNPYPFTPDCVDQQEICMGKMFGSESSVNYPLSSEDSATLYPAPVSDSFASTNTFHPPITLDPYLRIDDQNTVGQSDLTSQSIVWRLASLDVALHECGLKLPCPSEIGSSSAEVGRRKATMFVIDEVFRLSTEFLDVLTFPSHEAGQDQIILPISSLDQNESNAEATLPLFPDSQHLFRTVESSSVGEFTIPLAHGDEATMFMIMSCHSRLTKVYESLFKMMQACIEHSLAPRRDKDWTVILPRLQVGSIASPPLKVDIETSVASATVSMYMLMITMISSQVWAQLVDKMSVSDRISARICSRSTSTQNVWDKITDKNDRMMQTIDNIRQLL